MNWVGNIEATISNYETLMYFNSRKIHWLQKWDVSEKHDTIGNEIQRVSNRYNFIKMSRVEILHRYNKARNWDEGIIMSALGARNFLENRSLYQ